MSLFSAFILPQLEQELLTLEPQIAQFVVNQMHKVAIDVLDWAETKLENRAEGDAHEA